MNVFLAGGGRVGFHLAHLLSVEGHDVTIIENDPGRVERTDQALDVRVMPGNTASVMLLKEAGVGSADVFVAVTGQDELNLLAATTAKGLGAKQVVARVHDPTYIGDTILYEAILNIDYILSPEALTAIEIARFVENPGMVALEDFGRGHVQMRQVQATKSPTTGGKTLKDVCPRGCGVLLGVISRNGDTLIPHGDTVVEPGDLVTLIGRRDRIEQIQRQFQGKAPRAEGVVIMGGGGIGSHLAQVLENHDLSVKLLDRDLTRCQMLAARLKRVQVICGDATTRRALEQERVDRADVFVATTGDDENNIMASVLAKEMGAARTVAVVHEPDFAPLVSRLGIDHTVTPRAALANRVLRLVHQKSVSTLAVLEEGQVEVIEFSVESETPITGKPLKEIRNKFPRNTLVATILRGEEVIVPSGEDHIQVGDSVIMIAGLDSVEGVQKLFRP